MGGHLDLHFSVCTYVPKSCGCNSSYTPWWISFIPTHSDQHEIKMTVTIGFCDAASFTQSYGTFVIFFRYSITCDENMSEKHVRKDTSMKIPTTKTQCQNFYKFHHYLHSIRWCAFMWENLKWILYITIVLGIQTHFYFNEWVELTRWYFKGTHCQYEQCH